MLDDWSPLDEAESASQVDAVLALVAQRGWTRVADLGCGAGRITIPLARAGVRVLAIDADDGAIAALRREAEAAGISDAIETARRDFLAGAEALTFADGARADAALLLGNTLMAIHDVERAASLFGSLRKALGERGGILVDHFVRDVWADVAEGAWQEGVSEDGAWQMVWCDGDEVVAIRRGGDVDADGWEVREGDRRFRLWSLGSLRLLALASGWKGPVEDPTGALLVFGTT